MAETAKTSIHDINEKLTNSQLISTALAGGALAGAMAKTAIAPLDRTKIYFQTHPEKKYRIKGAVKFLRATYKNDGFWRLWRGNSATMARIAPYAAIQYMSHEQYKRLLGIHKPRPGNPRPGALHFVAGSMAGLTGQSLTYPLDRARAVLAVTKVGDYRNLIDVFRRIVHEEGVMALYRGFLPSMMGVVIYAGTSFFTYESLKHFWSGDGKETPTASQRLMSGACAGVLGQVTSYPLDIVRRRMQTANQMGVHANVYATVFATLWLILRREGIARGWYKGISMNFIKGPIANGISFTTFDYFQMGLRKLIIAVDRS